MLYCNKLYQSSRNRFNTTFCGLLSNYGARIC